MSEAVERRLVFGSVAERYDRYRFTAVDPDPVMASVAEMRYETLVCPARRS